MRPTPEDRSIPRSKEEQGVALVLVLIFSVLLFVIVSQLVVQARFHKRAGENDALLTRMNNQMQEVVLPQAEQNLIDDLTGGEAGAMAEGGEGGLGGLGGLGGAGGGQGGGEEEEEPTDSSQDNWYQPTAYADGDLTTYVWIEDDNRKFNLLSLASPDEEFATESRERLTRLLDGLREDTDHDISQSDAQTMTDAIKDWIDGRNRTDILPKPPLKSDQEDTETSIPLHLDELLLLRGVNEHLFYDQVMEYDNRIILLPGLESVLTIYTSWVLDPGDPEKQAQRGNNPGNDAGAGAGAGNANAGAGEEGEQQPSGEGIRLNINTVTGPVLRCLFTATEVPDSVIEAILRYRNEEAEEEEGAEGEAAEPELSEYSDLVMEGVEEQKQIFKSLEDLEKIPEFENLPDKKLKEEFLNLLTVRADVFSIHMAAVFKRNEERKVFVLHRRKSVVVRFDSEEEDPRLHPIIHLERRHGLRI
ncbi:MAG: hypothetical protein ACYTGW_20795, partial [Planctomycetota bacterium]